MYSTLSGSIFGIFILFYLNENITSVSLGYSLFLSSSIILLTSVFLSPIKGVITKEIIITIFIYILISLFDKKNEFEIFYYFSLIPPFYFLNKYYNKS